MDVTHLLQQTITIAPRTGMGADGTPTYGAQATRACRVEYAQGVVREGQDGTEIRTRATIITLAAIGPEDRVWLPGADTSSTAAARLPGPNGCQPAPLLLTGAIAFYQTEV
jgi:hypothetical protein